MIPYKNTEPEAELVTKSCKAQLQESQLQETTLLLYKRTLYFTATQGILKKKQRS